MKDICELEFHIHQIIADSTGAVGARTSRKNWVLRAGASSLYVTPCACLIIEQEGNGPLDQRATRAMKIGATFLILLNSVTTSDYHCTQILGFLQNFQHPAA